MLQDELKNSKFNEIFNNSTNSSIIKGTLTMHSDCKGSSDLEINFTIQEYLSNEEVII